MAVFGLGHIGLPVAAFFASRGFHVFGIDSDESLLSKVRGGRIPFYEPGLAELVKGALKERNLELTSDRVSAFRQSCILFVTVGTPMAQDGFIDLSQVRSVVTSLGEMMRNQEGHKLVVVKSTVIPGTTEEFIRPTLLHSSGKSKEEFGLAVNPDFLTEGSAIEDLASPERIIIGSLEQSSIDALKEFYSELYSGQPPIMLTTNTLNAEIIKYASNSFLATKISFINELADFCEGAEGADVQVVSQGMGLDKRIGSEFLRAGLGYGGSCFSKDNRALMQAAARVGAPLSIVGAAEEYNSARPGKIVERMDRIVGGLAGKKIALLGVAFKPGTDDIRDAISTELALELLRKGSRISAYDPIALPNFREALGDNCEYAASVSSCVQDADCCLLVTEWDEFRTLEPLDFQSMKQKILIDGRRIYDPNKFTGRMKFVAIGLGTQFRRGPPATESGV